MLLCIDIGNTHTHYGLVNPGTASSEGALSQHDTPTRTLDDPAAGMAPQIAALLAPAPGNANLLIGPPPQTSGAARRHTDQEIGVPNLVQLKAVSAGRAVSPKPPKISGTSAALSEKPPYLRTFADTALSCTLPNSAIEGLAFCSVVPDATERLRAVLAREKFPFPVLHLTHDKKLGVPVTYPRPAEIGQDRLANAAAASILGPLPAIVIDMGTAVTFDIITRAHGYEGGIIAPGVELMRRYLHEQTAQLPLLDESIAVTGAVGHSTIEAMRIGTVIGFGGMIQALLDTVLADLAARGETHPRLYATGGAAALLRDRLRYPLAIVPDLTLRGLAAAWKLERK